MEEFALAEFRPFRAIHYNPGRFGRDWSSVIAPPYDVLDAADKTRLIEASGSNIVAVDLPVAPAKKPGPPAVYEQAAATLRRWLDDGTFVRHDVPAFYIYHQAYTHAGREYTRRMMLAAMRIEPFGEGTVFAHEQTYGGPKEDRLLLMRATKCQLSPVFGLFSDPSHSVAAALDVADREPDVTATQDGVVNRLWFETNEETIAHVAMLLSGARVYIADGHHRYSTALNYRDEIRAPGHHPSQYVLICLCAMEDPGCLILPTHRVLTAMGGMSAGTLMKTWAPACTFAPAAPSMQSPDRAVAPDSPHDVALFADGRFHTGTFTNRDMLGKLAPDKSFAWRALDLAYLHRYMIDSLLTNGPLNGESPTIAYTPSADEAVRLARESGGVAILVKPTTMDELHNVSQARDLMPQKSTYFYPKLATGLVIHSLD